MAEIDLNQLRAQERAKIPQDPYGTRGRGMGIDALFDAREEGLSLARSEPRLRIRVPERFTITEYVDQTPKTAEDGGRLGLSGAKYQVIYVPGEYNVKAERVYFGREARHWAFQCYKAEFLCSECWQPEPEHSPGCPAVEKPARVARPRRKSSAAARAAKGRPRDASGHFISRPPADP